MAFHDVLKWFRVLTLENSGNLSTADHDCGEPIAVMVLSKSEMTCKFFTPPAMSVSMIVLYRSGSGIITCLLIAFSPKSRAPIHVQFSAYFRRLCLSFLVILLEISASEIHHAGNLPLIYKVVSPGENFLAFSFCVCLRVRGGYGSGTQQRNE